jgi:hypothetical protein
VNTVPYITNYAPRPTTRSARRLLEGTYGFIRNELTGGNEKRGHNDSVEPAQRLARVPVLPESQVDTTTLLRQRSLDDVARRSGIGTR